MSKPLTIVCSIVLGVAIGAVGAMGAVYALRGSSEAKAQGKRDAAAEKTPSTAAGSVELVEGMPYTLQVPENVRKGLRLGKSEIVEPARQSRPLVMPGSTALDPTRLMRVKARFNAEVVEIAQLPYQDGKQTEFRELRAGDKVKKGDVLAVVWSIDVGGRKSDLVDALVQLWLDEERLKARMILWDKGSIPEDTLNQTRRDVVSDQNAADRAERTLRTWNVPEHEIEAVREEARQAYLRRGKRDKEKEKLWARSELVAPRDGTIVERNVGIGEYVADNTINLFTIADVSSILIMANPPEDQLPTLLSMSPDQLRWTLRTVGARPITGKVDDISYILDPAQHTAVLKGNISNPEGRLRAGQFVSATIELPPPPDTVEVPLTALAEDGKQSCVFVQPDPNLPRYTMRRVLVTHRFEKTAFVRSQLKSEEERPSEEGLLPCQPLKPGERILTSGVLELRAAVEDMMSKNQKVER